MGGETCRGDSCIASDSFGLFHWGWFAAGDRLCLVPTEREVRARRADHPNRDCTLQIEQGAEETRPVMILGGERLPLARVRAGGFAGWWARLVDALR
jgi:hypothetical protein